MAKPKPLFPKVLILCCICTSRRAVLSLHISDCVPTYCVHTEIHSPGDSTFDSGSGGPGFESQLRDRLS